MRNCVIIHGCSSAPGIITFENHWISWVAQKLNTHDIHTTTPRMPEPWQPQYEDYKKEFEKENIDENTILIGHSCGCAFLVRWLGESKQKIDTLILVAPWKIAGEQSPKKSFYQYTIDETIPERVKKIIMFTSDTEEKMGKDSLAIFQNALNGKIISLTNKGHYTPDDMNTNEFPELLKEIIN